MTRAEETSDVDRAREKALIFLEHRDRTRQEVRVRLERYGFEPPVVSEVCTWLEELDLVNDRRFAESYAADRCAAGWGARRIVRELWKKGIDRAIAMEAANPTGVPDETAVRVGVAGVVGGSAGTLVDMVVRRFGREFASDPQRAERRAAGFLARRGHEWPTIKQVLAEARRRVGHVEEEPWLEE